MVQIDNKKKIKTIAIFFEDSKSSYFFISELCKLYRKINLISFPQKGDTPLQLVTTAIKYKHNPNNFRPKTLKQANIIYCIYDYDRILNSFISKDDYNTALKLAKENKIKLFICNPNFEKFHMDCFGFIKIDDLLKYYSPKNIKDKNKQKTLEELKSDKIIYKNLSYEKEQINSAININKNNHYSNEIEKDFAILVDDLIEK